MLACGCGPRLYPVLSSLVCVGFFLCGSGPGRCVILGGRRLGRLCVVLRGVLCFHRVSLWWHGVLRGAVLGWLGGGHSGWRCGLGRACAGDLAWTGGDGAVCGLGLRLRVCGFYVSSCPLYYRRSDSPPPIFFFVLCSLF